MRLLLDECIDERLRLLFPNHDCQTARFADLAGLKNGLLLEAAWVGATMGVEPAVIGPSSGQPGACQRS